LHRNLERLNITQHVAVYFLASLAVALLLFEQAQLSSRAGVPVDVLGTVLVQQAVMALLLFGLAMPVHAWKGRHWPYALASILFVGYSGLRMIAAFTAILGLVPTLNARGIPISDYQGTFYIFALVAAISYLWSILALRRSYEELANSQTLDEFP
jgi:hypothetical protein